MAPAVRSFPAQSEDKLMHLARPFHDGLGRCVITLADRADPDCLARAVKLSLEAAPILDCSYVTGAFRSRWRRAEHPSDAFSWVRTPDAEGELQDFLAAPLDPGRPPQVAVRLIRPGPAAPGPEADVGPDRLCIKMSHMVVDARGLLDYVRLLSGIYRRIQSDPAWVPALSGADRGLGQVLRRAGPGAVLLGCLHLRYPRSDWGFPATSSDLSGRSFLFRRIGPERVARIRDYSRGRRVRFTDVLATAFYRGLAGVLKPQAGARLPVQMTIDLRRYLPGARADALCGLAGTFYPVIRHDPRAGFEQTLGAVSAASARERRRQPWLGACVLMALAGLLPPAWQARIARRTMSRAIRSGRAHPFFANLGRLDPRIFQFGETGAVDVAIFGPVAFPPNFQLTVYTVEDVLSITVGFPGTAVDPALLRQFLEDFLKELPG